MRSVTLFAEILFKADQSDLTKKIALCNFQGLKILQFFCADYKEITTVDEKLDEAWSIGVPGGGFILFSILSCKVSQGIFE